MSYCLWARVTLAVIISLTAQSVVADVCKNDEFTTTLIRSSGDLCVASKIAQRPIYYKMYRYKYPDVFTENGTLVDGDDDQNAKSWVNEQVHAGVAQLNTRGQHTINFLPRASLNITNNPIPIDDILRDSENSITFETGFLFNCNDNRCIAINVGSGTGIRNAFNIEILKYSDILFNKNRVSGYMGGIPPDLTCSDLQQTPLYTSPIPASLSNVITHELGHTFGLGHVIGGDGYMSVGGSIDDVLCGRSFLQQNFNSSYDTIEALFNSSLITTVEINDPEDRSIFDWFLDLINFNGSAINSFGDDISSQLVWTSDQDGVIGTGAHFSTKSLSKGVHQITVSLEESGSELDSFISQLEASSTKSSTPANLFADSLEITVQGGPVSRLTATPEFCYIEGNTSCEVDVSWNVTGMGTGHTLSAYVANSLISTALQDSILLNVTQGPLRVSLEVESGSGEKAILDNIEVVGLLSRGTISGVPNTCVIEPPATTCEIEISWEALDTRQPTVFNKTSGQQISPLNMPDGTPNGTMLLQLSPGTHNIALQASADSGSYILDSVNIVVHDYSDAYEYDGTFTVAPTIQVDQPQTAHNLHSSIDKDYMRGISNTQSVPYTAIVYDIALGLVMDLELACVYVDPNGPGGEPVDRLKPVTPSSKQADTAARTITLSWTSSGNQSDCTDYVLHTRHVSGISGNTATYSIKLRDQNSPQNPFMGREVKPYFPGVQDIDANQFTVNETGDTITINGNSWKILDYPYPVRSNTWMTFEYRSTGDEGEIMGVGIGKNPNHYPTILWQVDGTQVWHNQDYNNYSGSQWKTYGINIGDYYTGDIKHVMLLSDADAANLNTSVSFRNVKIFELGGRSAEWGHTGNWYNPSTNGQGFTIEINPNNEAAVIHWFTYSPNGQSQGVNGQRWYIKSSDYTPGDRRVEVDIYEVTGGVFNQSNPVSERVVGQAVLQFKDCKNGILEYLFTLGENAGRTGAMQIQRLLPNIDCGIQPYTGTGKRDFGYSGNWYNPNTPGQGFYIEANPAIGALVTHWFTYKRFGAGQGVEGHRWFIMSGSYTPGGPNSNSMTIYQTTGGAFDQASSVTETPVGTASIRFSSCTSGTLTFNFTSSEFAGMSGSIPIRRLTQNVNC